MRDMYRRTIEQWRVGVSASAIHAFAAEQFRHHGYGDRVSLVGHGWGPSGINRSPIL